MSAALSAARVILRTARLADADPRIATLVGTLHDALVHEDSASAVRVVSQMRMFCGNGLKSRFVPRTRPRKRGVAHRAKSMLRGGRIARVDASGSEVGGDVDEETVKLAFEQALEDGKSLALAMHHVAQVAAGGMSDERLRLPGLSGIEGSLKPDKELRAGTLLVANAADPAPGRGVYVLLGAESRDPDGAGPGRETVRFRALCVNRPLPATAADVVPELNLGPLAANFVFWGGADDEAVYILHPHSTLPGAQQLSDDASLAAGVSIADAAAVLHDGDAQAGEFKVVQGSTLLTYDVEADDFVEAPGCVAARGTAAAGLALAPALLEGSARHRGDANAWYEHDKFFHQDVVWREAMVRLGGECAAVAEMHPSVVQVVRAALGIEDEGDDIGVVDAETSDEEGGGEAADGPERPERS